MSHSSHRRSILLDGADPAQVPPLDPDDPGLTLGLSAFETLRTYGRRPTLLARHHARLVRSAEALGLQAPALPLLAEEVAHVIASLGGEAEEVAVRVTLTGGGRRIVRAQPAPPLAPALACALAPWHAAGGLELAKHGSRAPWAVQVRALGVDDVIGLDAQTGEVVEGTAGAVLVRLAGQWWTPPEEGRRLPSVTLAVLSEVAEIGRRRLAARDLWAAEEVYLCSALKVLGAVVRLDGAPCGGRGPAGEALRGAFLDRVSRDDLLEEGCP